MNIYKEEEELQSTGEVSPDDLELLSLVKINPGLWNNNLKIYSNANDKNLAWSLLGQSLTTPLSGSEAQKKFINWLTTFGRLHKKVLRSQSKSGSSNDQLVYVPTWPLYNELLFLKNVIKPRGTKSNFVKLACVPSNKPTSTSILKKYQSPLMANTMIQELLNDIVNTSLQLNELATSVEDSSTFLDSQYIESPQNSFYDSQTENVSDAGSVMSLVKKLEDSQPKEKIKVKTLPSDNFYNKKEIKDDEDLKMLKDMIDSVRIMTTTLATSMSKLGMSQNFCDRLTETLSPEIEAFIQILKSSLGRIPPTSRLTCLIELLPIMQKYEQA